MNAWLIECVPTLGDVLYYCNDGDWCNNPNHAHKFSTVEQANMKMVTMQSPHSFRVAEHEWCDGPSLLKCPECGADRTKEPCGRSSMSYSDAERLDAIIASAINHHAGELARLTETWPVDSAPPPLSAPDLFISEAVTVLRKHRYCGDQYPENGWPDINNVLALYETLKRTAHEPPDMQRDAERWGVVLHNAAATDALFKVFDPHDEHRHINNAIDAARAAQAKEGGL